MAYHSFAGEVEASNTPTIRRLTPSRRHQLPRIALETVVDSEGVEVADLNEARGLALEAVAEMTQARAGEITAWRGWRLEAV